MPTSIFNQQQKLKFSIKGPPNDYSCTDCFQLSL